MRRAAFVLRVDHAQIIHAVGGKFGAQFRVRAGRAAVVGGEDVTPCIVKREHPIQRGAELRREHFGDEVTSHSGEALLTSRPVARVERRSPNRLVSVVGLKLADQEIGAPFQWMGRVSSFTQRGASQS